MKINTLYKDDIITIKTYEKEPLRDKWISSCSYGSFFLYKTTRVRFTDKIITQETATYLAPMFKMIYERVFDYAHVKGYRDGLIAKEQEFRDKINKFLKGDTQ